MSQRVKTLTFLPDAPQFANVPEYFVSGPSYVEIIDGCVVRVHLIDLCEAPTGTPLIVPQCRLNWTVPRWLDARRTLNEVREAIQAAGCMPHEEVRRLAGVTSH